MLNNNLQKTLFHLTSVLTTWFPRGGAKFFDTVLPPVAGNRALVNYISRKNLKIIKKVKKFEKILVIPDIHIGDAIMMQAAVAAFRDFFPEARIDYIVKKSVACLIEGNPDISNLYPYFTGTVFPAPSDLESLRRLAAENQYDLCYNCSPFFEKNHFPTGQVILDFLTTSFQVVRNDIDQTGVNHSIFQCYDLPHRLLSQLMPMKRLKPLTGVPITLSDKAIAEAQAFLKDNQVPAKGPILLLNPDTASPFTRVPFDDQAELLKRLVQIPGHLLLGSAFTARGIEQRLLEKLSPEEKARITIVPTSMTLDGYNALVDFADVFISGDTGPLHMAAARKFSRSGNFNFRNKTFIVSIFGATPQRVSGYDSKNPLFLPANQDVQSRTYVSESPCRNITCVNKMYKTCKVVRCFEVLDVENIAVDIKLHLNGLKTGTSA
jgi:heptosyltransferase-1